MNDEERLHIYSLLITIINHIGKTDSQVLLDGYPSVMFLKQECDRIEKETLKEIKKYEQT